MQNKLYEMSLEELWQLFPIELAEHNPEWFIWYDEEKNNLLSVLGNTIKRIDHIGSTSIPGLLAKPIVDILLQISPLADTDGLKATLADNGWLLMAENTRTCSFDFNKGYTPDGFAERVFHLHVKRIGDHDEIHFRDYIAAHPEDATEYAALKRQLLALYKYNRDAYTEAKTEFIRKIIIKGKTVKDQC